MRSGIGRGRGLARGPGGQGKERALGSCRLRLRDAHTRGEMSTQDARDEWAHVIKLAVTFPLKPELGTRLRKTSWHRTNPRISQDDQESREN